MTALPAWTIESDPFVSFTNDSWVFGNSFTVGACDIIVSALGYYDNAQDGFIQDHDVAIYNKDTSTLITQTTVRSSDPLTNLWRFRSVTPVTLTAGGHYIVVGISHADLYTWNDPSFAVNPIITYTGNGWVTGSFLTIPPDQNDVTDGYWGANFIAEANCGGSTATITVVKVTEPSTDTTSFAFTTTGGLSPSTFNLVNGGTQLFPGIAAGTYGITETPNASYITSYSVSNGNAHTAITVASGDSVTVTITNKKKASLTVKKVVNPYDASAPTFSFTATNLSPSTFTLAGGDNQAFTGLDPGLTYGISEGSNPQYNTNYFFSDGQTDPDNIVIPPGEDLVLTVMNVKPSDQNMSGIYEIIPSDATAFGKSSDDLAENTMVDGHFISQNTQVAIPEPSATTGLVRDL